MSLWDYAFGVMMTALAIIGAYVTVLGLITRNPHTMVAASMLMISSASVVSIALAMRQSNRGYENINQPGLDHQPTAA
ncbi:hypothetical protein [Vulcanisaeta distributa]|uniref:hypothetical protein n=1 Tax=Vulcanisaeta distributa TaxID=164451 RepID=UPI0006D1364E|nr:hypothetical protein [Vulcanisaeta distributa]